ncbi:unnamed protein product [Ambrosiozyma monospora]|uniref:Unnamed protein product n=1 Tax=Ambrosiozyma monospora TaxID=43982 RepID=A0ACB5U503_AMBMO|nr:unnamed protein product [Ambrosiozyma monospora]
MSLTDLKQQAKQLLNSLPSSSTSLSQLNNGYGSTTTTTTTKPQDLSITMRHSSSLNATLHPPTDEEWEAERQRIWSGLSRGMKKSFKKPQPGSVLTDEKLKLLDSISRGVDGGSSEYDNFVVVCMFVDSVDYVDFSGGGRDRRYVYKKTGLGTWREIEVCP